METDVAKFLLSVLSAGGGGAFVAYYVFKRLGDAWLEARFAEKLEAYRHDRAKELERLRAEIDGALKAQVRFQEKQFEACLDIWNALKEAQSELLGSISPLQQYSDIKRLDEDARAEYLNTLDLKKWQVDEILSAPDIQAQFMETMNRMRFNAAAQAFSEFDRVTRRYELFLNPETFALIRSVADAMRSSLVAKEMSLDQPDHKLSHEAWSEYDKNCVPLVKKLVPQLQELIEVR
ncbi:hypothetical protein [Roseovarius sp.]|uniref:hypothetical protein n=1 Tax=Roseovarius sp. TaxID=1486281 RepID=UPI003BAD941D